MEKAKLNILPVPTFGWLNVNEAVRELTPYPEAGEQVIAGNNDDAVRLDIQKNGQKVYKLIAKEGESLTAIEYIDAENADIKTDITAESGSNVKLIQVIVDTAQTVNSVKAELSDNAGFELVQLTLGGGDTLSDINVSLNGRASHFKADLGFKLKDDNKLDINLLASHRGKKTESLINASGVLSDNADKIFKGTIDFLNGAVGGKGAEKEEVLLLDEGVRNRTVPLILCAEEDVEGSHGASIGRIDEAQVFYLQSRGLTEEKIYEFMANSKIEQVVRKIGDGQTISRINKALGGKKDE